MTEEVWAVICEAMERYKGVSPTAQHRAEVEQSCRFVEFDGGAFVIKGAEVDCFVTSDRRKRWATRKLLDGVLGGLVQEHGRATCSVHPENADSLNFARRLGFKETERTDNLIRLELKSWKLLAA